MRALRTERRLCTDGRPVQAASVGNLRKHSHYQIGGTNQGWGNEVVRATALKEHGSPP